MELFSGGEENRKLFSAKWLWGTLAVSLALSFVVFGNGVGGDFIFDDTLVIIGNPLIGHGIPDVWTIFTSPYHFHQPRTGLYRPFTIFSFALNWFLCGSSPVSFHIVNIILHALTVWVLILLFSMLFGKNAALGIGLIFLVLPIHVEDVTSIVGRAEILSLLGGLSALLFMIRGRPYLAAAAFFMGVFSKETAMAFLPFAVYLAWYIERRNFRQALRFAMPMILVGIVYAVMRYAALGQYFLQNDATFISNPIKYAPWLAGFWTACSVFFRYIYHAVIPVSYSPDYSYDQIKIVSSIAHSPEAAAGLLVLSLLLFFVFVRRYKELAIGSALLLFPYFVISNFVLKIGTIMADRLFYAPSIGLIVIVLHVLRSIKRRLRVPARYAAVSLCIVAIIYTGVTMHRNTVWADERSLFEYAYSAAPESVVNQTNKAYLLLRAGEYGEAKEIIDKVIAKTPEHLPALNLAGQIYKKLGQLQQAEAFWKKTISIRGDFLNGYSNLGILYYENGYLASAERVLTDAVAVYPRWSEVFELAMTKIALGKFDEAIEVATKYPKAYPDIRQRKLVLGIAFVKKGDLARAREYLWDIRDENISYDEFINRIKKGVIFDLGNL